MNRITHQRHHYMALLATIVLLLLGSLPSHARDPIFSQKDNYTVYLAGYNKLHFKLPLYDSDNMDRWAKGITIYAGDKALFTYKTTDDKYNKCQANATNVGKLQIWSTTGYQDITTELATFSVPTPIYCATDEAYVEFEWYAPGDWSGEYQITAQGKYYWRTEGDIAIGTKGDHDKSGTVDMAKINFTQSEKPEISTVLPSYEDNRAGTYSAIWYVAASKVSKVEWSENNSGNWKEMPGTDANGILYLDAYKPHPNVQIRATYSLPNGQVTTQTSNGKDINMLHKPINLKTRIKDNGDFNPYAQLSWTINDATQPDFYDNDTWEVQRNCSGNPNDEDQWQSVGMVDYNNDERDQTFTYNDETLLSAYVGHHTIYYRVRRLNTAMWGWSEQSGYALDSVTFVPAYRSIKDGCQVRSINGNKVSLSLGQFDDQRPDNTWLYYINGKARTVNGWTWDKDAKVKLLTEFWQKG